MKIIIVDKQSLEIKASYEAPQLFNEYHEQVCYCAGALCEPICQHIALPEGLLEDEAKAQLDENNEIELVQDADKVQAKRNAKLDELRQARALKLAEVDLIVNDLALSDTEYTANQIKVYRQALKDITNSYKDESGNATSAIDSLDIDNFSFPTIGE